MKNITVKFDGEIVNCIEFSYVGWTEANCNECGSHERVKEIEYFSTDDMIEMANDEENKDIPFYQIAEIDLNTTDKWMIAETKNEFGLVLFKQMVAIHNVIDIEIYQGSLKPDSLKKNRLRQSEAERMK